MNRRSALFTIGVAAVMVLWVCVAYASGASADDPVSDPYNWGVLFLMAMPYAVAGSVAGWIFYSYRRAGKKSERKKKRLLATSSTWIHKESGK